MVPISHGAMLHPKQDCATAHRVTLNSKYGSVYMSGTRLIIPITERREPGGRRLSRTHQTPYKQYLIEEVEKVQKRATKLVHECKHLAYGFGYSLLCVFLSVGLFHLCFYCINMTLIAGKFGYLEWLSYNREHVSLLSVPPFSI